MLKKVLITAAVVTVSCTAGYIICMNDVVKKHGDILPDNELTVSVLKGRLNIIMSKKPKS